MPTLKYPLKITRGFVYYLVINYLKLKYKFQPSKTVVVTIPIKDKAIELVVNLNDKGLPSDIFHFRTREYPNTIYFAEYLQKNSRNIETIIDIGANIGFYVLIENAILHTPKNIRPKIYAIEPVESNIQSLKKNIGYNLIENIEIRKVAVGDTNKKSEIIVPAIKNHSRIVGVGKSMGELDKKETIDMVTLQTFFRLNKIKLRNVLIRMDIEGYEYNLIMNNKNFINKLKNFYVVFEFHPYYLGTKNTVKFLKYLQDLGFKLDQVVSCEPLYFTATPNCVRKLLKLSWLIEHRGKKLGLLNNYKNFVDLINDAYNKNNAIYNYPNLHLYLHKK